MRNVSKFHLLAYLVLLAALTLSIAGNYFLFDRALAFYQREAAVRINPIDHRYADENQELLAKGKAKTRLIIFGESRAHMWQVAHPKNWGDFEIINRGIGGETTPQILGRLETDVLALDPDIVVLQMGDNDLKTMAMIPGSRKSTSEKTYHNITTIAKRIADSGAQVILTTIFPPGPIELLRKPLWSDEVNESIDEMNDRLLAFEYPGVVVVDCDKILREGKYIKPEYSIDTLHLKKAGYVALNIGLEPVLAPVLEKYRD